ncbi:MAG: ABC transporter permease [Anaerolineales bacterium]|nr:ABC transporter permease [Anaerolineales bacterium]
MKSLSNPSLHTLRDNLLLPLLSVFTAILVGSLFMLANGYNAVAAYGGMLQGALGSPEGIAHSILNAVPLTFAGLSVAFAFKGGLFNIGGEGQLFFGAVTSAWIGIALGGLGLPGIVHVTLALLAGFTAGSLWAAISGVLKAYTGAHEVITTIMLNYIAIVFTGWLVSQGSRQQGIPPGPLRDPNPLNIVPRTAPVAESARLPTLFEVGDQPVHFGVILAILAVIIIWWLVWRSTFGFELRMVGLNPSAGKYAGVNVARTTVITMAIAGGLAGLAGAVETVGRTYYFAPNFNVGYGFDAIAVALLGKSHPVGVMLAALLFGTMDAGSTDMQLAARVPTEIIQIVQALVLIFVAAPEIIRFLYRVRAEKEERTTLSAGWGKR